MNGRCLTWAAVAAIVCCAAPALAASGETPASASTSSATTLSAFALPVAELGVEPEVAVAFTGGEPSTSLKEFAQGPKLEAVRYRPRRPRDRDHDYYEPRRSRGPLPGSFFQVHAGAFDPENGSASGILIGFRGGPQFDETVAIGGGLDWRFKEERSSAIISEEPLPGGGTREVRRELSRSSTHWFPIMAHIQVSPRTADLGVVPYFGAAGGYQVLFISAEDFQTGEEFEGTFDGWGWQLFGGVGVPLSGRTRLNAEVFLNGAELDREVEDTLTGDTFHEIVDMDGIGMRIGFSWGS